MSAQVRIFAVFLLLLLCGAAAWWLVDRPEAGSPVAIQAVVAEQGPNARVGAPTDQPADELQRVAVAADERLPPAARQATDAAPLLLRGRCVDEDGTPLEGCEIRTWRDDEPPPVEPIQRSTADGQFAAALPVDGEQALALNITAAGRVPVSARLARPLPGEEIDLGDVLLRQAIRVRGQVVDDRGAPVPNVRMQFVRIDLTARDRPHGTAVQATPDSMLASMTGPDGRFALDEPAWRGEWFLGVEYTGALIEPRNVQLGDSLRDFELRIVVQRPDPEFTVTGRVVDSLGSPVDGATLMMIGSGFIGRGRSGSDGRFEVPRAGPMSSYGRAGMRVSVDHASRAFNALDDGAYSDTEWGDDALEIVLHRKVGRSVRVVDDTGTPVENYTLLPFREIVGQFSRHRRARLSGRHPDGRCTLTGLSRGRQGVIVLPQNPALASTEMTTFEVGHESQGPEQLITVPRRVPLRITVLGSDGQPRAGSNVELLQRLGKVSATPSSPATALADCDRTSSPITHLVIANGETDADGVLELAASPGSWELRVRGDRHVALVEPLQVTAPRTERRVTVTVGARLRGSVGPGEALAQLRALADERVLQVEADPVENGLPIVELPVDREGRFDASGLAPGDYRIKFRFDYDSSGFFVAKDSWRIDEVSLREGGEQRLDIDVAAFLPATVHGRVTVDGEPLREVHCFLRRRTEAGRVQTTRVGTNAEGRFTAKVRPGEYEFSATLAAHPGPGWIRMPLLEQSWSFTPSGEHQMVAALTLRRARIHLVDANGSPLADQPLRIRHTLYHIPGDLRTDGRGWLELDPAPPGPFQIRTEIAGEQIDLGPFDLPAGARSGDVIVPIR